jgi:hypothetical protein
LFVPWVRSDYNESLDVENHDEDDDEDERNVYA